MYWGGMVFGTTPHEVDKIISTLKQYSVYRKNPTQAGGGAARL